MEEKFKLKKFHRDSSGFHKIRYKDLPSGKIIAFGVAGTDLSTMQFGTKIDFDKESDEILKKYHDSKNNMAFVYIPNFGFDEVDIRQQSWFIFK